MTVLYTTGRTGSLSVADVTYDPGFFEDLRISAGFRQGGANQPTGVAYPTNGAWCYAFNTSNYLGFTSQIPHAWHPGTDMHLHLHWTPGARGTTESGKTVAWKVNLALADISQAFPSISTYDLTDTCDGVDHKNQYVEATIDVDMSTFTGPSTIICGRVYRDSGDNWAGTNANAPILLELDFHFVRGRPGSRRETVY